MQILIVFNPLQSTLFSKYVEKILSISSETPCIFMLRTFNSNHFQKYGIEIKDDRQPILISQPRAREVRGGVAQPAWLIPELCRITGLDERQRNDIR